MGPGGGRPLSLPGPARWARELCRRYAGADPVALAGAVARRVAAELGDPTGSCLDRTAPSQLSLPWPPAGSASRDLLPVADGPDPPGGWRDPWLVGIVHELAAPAADRRARGAWYTPRPVVEGLLALAFAPAQEAAGPDLVVDPTCGGGAFLLAALDRFVTAGVGPVEALRRVAGLDLDPGAVEVTRWGLALWWLARGDGGGPAPEPDVAQGDALAPWPDRWRRGPVLVIGNPPFATPLKQGTLPEEAARYRAGRTEVLGPYADLAAIHLLRATEQAAPGSTVALVQPQSVLAGRDTAGLRAHLASAAPLRALWAAREAVFDAGVRACAVVLDVGGRPLGDVGADIGVGIGARRDVRAGGDVGAGVGSAAESGGGEPGPSTGGGPAVLIAHGPTVVVDGRRPLASWADAASGAVASSSAVGGDG